MARFDIFQTDLNGLKVIVRKPILDERGFFERLFCADEFRALGLHKSISQINHTLTRNKGAARGLHFQYPPHAEIKVVSCLQGSVFDVAVDLRKDSPTFLKWHAEILSSDNQKSLFIPEGFAHGFQTLTENCELVYLHSESYKQEAEGALNLRDPAIGIKWPMPFTELSERDRNHHLINHDFIGITL